MPACGKEFFYPRYLENLKVEMAALGDDARPLLGARAHWQEVLFTGRPNKEFYDWKPMKVTGPQGHARLNQARFIGESRHRMRAVIRL